MRAQIRTSTQIRICVSCADTQTCLRSFWLAYISAGMCHLAPRLLRSLVAGRVLCKSLRHRRKNAY
eukprot:6203986-Pleurochrysis_carterae.AAC.1